MSRRRLAGVMVALGMLVVACDSTSTPGSSGAGSPPTTESETGRVVGQPIEVDSFTVEVTGAGSALFIVSGLVPSTCHQAVFGFEEPNSEGIMIGVSESWLDPDCDAPDEPVSFTEPMEVDGLPPGEYRAELDGELETSFVIPDPTEGAATTGGGPDIEAGDEFAVAAEATAEIPCGADPTLLEGEDVDVVATLANPRHPGLVAHVFEAKDEIAALSVQKLFFASCGGIGVIEEPRILLGDIAWKTPTPRGTTVFGTVAAKEPPRVVVVTMELTCLEDTCPASHHIYETLSAFAYTLGNIP